MNCTKFPFAAGLALFTGALAAQDQLEEIVVTARFRDAALMGSAGSSSVFAAEEIEALAARHVESLLNAAPNVGFSGGASRARFVQIRGIGDLEQFVDPKHFPSVGVAVDSINLGGTANAAMLLDIEQVEILRGPQGTNFGTSALAGLINLRGRRPSDELRGNVELGAGSYGSRTVEAALGGRLAPSVAARIAVQRNSGDGYVENVFLGRDDTNGYDETAARAIVEVTPNDRSSYSLTALHFKGDNGYDAFSLNNTRQTLSDAPGRDRQRTAALSATGRWKVGARTDFEVIATWLENAGDYGFDEDWTYVGYCDGTFCDPELDFFSNTDRYLRDRREVSMDARLLGGFGRDLQRQPEYVVGAYAQRRREDLGREYYGRFDSRYDVNRAAVYGQIDVPLGSRFNLTAGARIEAFDDDYDDSFAFSSHTRETLTSGELTATYSLGDRTIMYATWSRGEKAGGVNTEASANFPFMQAQFQQFITPRLAIDPEVLTNVEIGIKRSAAAGRLELRGALFDMRRRDAQLESWIWDAESFLWIGFLDNADGSNSGLELELDYRFADQLTVFGSLGLLSTDVERMTTFDLDLNEFETRTGIDQARSPNWQYRLGMRAELSARVAARLEFQGRDGARYGYYHDGVIGTQHVVNASLIMTYGATEVQLWGRNLSDEQYAIHGLYFGNDPRKGWVNESYYQWAEPRVIGVSMRYRFD